MNTTNKKQKTDSAIKTLATEQNIHIAAFSQQSVTLSEYCILNRPSY
jgi:hypothetical protein